MKHDSQLKLTEILPDFFKGEDADLPLVKLFEMELGDVIVSSLSDGRHVIWQTIMIGSPSTNSKNYVGSAIRETWLVVDNSILIFILTDDLKVIVRTKFLHTEIWDTSNITESRTVYGKHDDKLWLVDGVFKKMKKHEIKKQTRREK